MKYIISALIILALVSCEKDNPGKALLLVNNSSTDNYFFISNFTAVAHFPDTLLPPNREELNLQFIGANGRSGRFQNPDWQSIYSNLPDNKFTIYILSVDVVDNTDWQTVRDQYLILERQNITFEELDASDYTITYED